MSTDLPIVIPELNLLHLDPAQWDCPTRESMGETEWRQRKAGRVAFPHLDDEEWAAWDQLVREVFRRNEEHAIRFALTFLSFSFQSKTPEFRRMMMAHRTSAVYRRNLKREEFEQQFRMCGDLVLNVEEYEDIASAAHLLAEQTEFLDSLPTQVEKRIHIRAAHQSPFWRLVTFLVSKVNHDPGVEDPRYVKQAHRWIQGWEAMRRGEDIEA